MQINPDLHGSLSACDFLNSNFMQKILIEQNKTEPTIALVPEIHLFACVFECLSSLPLSDRLPVQTGNAFFGVRFLSLGVCVFLCVCLCGDRQQTCHGIL